MALCTFEGARFLEEQLDSILGQTVLPDELVVCDDGSSDWTVDILQAFRDVAPFPVRIERNPRLLGSTANFGKAIGLCSEQVIVLCDQDDVWLPLRLEITADVFGRRPDLGLFFSDAELIDDRSRPTGERLWWRLGIRPAAIGAYLSGDRIDRVEQLTWGNLVTGATAAFRTSFRDLVLPIPDGWVHDAWIALILSASAPVEASTVPLVRYRVHPAQQIGIHSPGEGKRRTQLVRRARKRERYLMRRQSALLATAAERLRAAGLERPPEPGLLEYLEGKARHFAVRGAIDRPGRLATIAREVRAGGYRRFS
ncbi:MAG TPA: glycosyltransferase, partial [Actinomycetota bacterium]|nr:glycosyltransferase [Actinomycetota bacterium]